MDSEEKGSSLWSASHSEINLIAANKDGQQTVYVCVFVQFYRNRSDRRHQIFTCEEPGQLRMMQHVATGRAAARLTSMNTFMCLF